MMFAADELSEDFLIYLGNVFSKASNQLTLTCTSYLTFVA